MPPRTLAMNPLMAGFALAAVSLLLFANAKCCCRCHGFSPSTRPLFPKQAQAQAQAQTLAFTCTKGARSTRTCTTSRHVLPACDESKSSSTWSESKDVISSITDSATVPAHAHSRRHLLTDFSAATLAAAAAAIVPSLLSPPSATAAPPMAVIAEELGYFPVTNSAGTTQYVPSRVRRSSTDQSISLATYLEKTGATMYGAYWCPHCSRQREMFGRQAWSSINYVECSPKGYGADLKLCAKNNIEGFPTWIFANGQVGSGEMTLDRIAEMSGYKGKFDGGLEEPLPMGGGSCR